MPAITRGNPEEYRQLAALLKAAEPTIRRQYRARIREAAKPLGEKTAKEGAFLMPRRGGYRARMQDRAKATLSQTQRGVRMVLGRKGAYPAGPNRTGWVRHPIPNTSGSKGASKKWAGTRTVPGTWTRAFDRNSDAAVKVVAKALDDVLKEITS